MNNKIIFGQYYPADSWIHRLDPRVKLFGLLSLIVSLFIINNIYVMLGFTLFLILLIITTKIPMQKFFKSIRMMSYIMIFTFIVQLFTKTGGDLIGEYNLTLNVASLSIIIVTLLLWIFFSKYIKFFKIPLFIGLIYGAFVLQYYLNTSPEIKNYTIKIFEDGLIEASFIVIRIIDFLFISSLLTLTTKPTQINCALDKSLKPLEKIKINVSAFSMIISITLRFVPTLLLEADKILKAQASRGADFKEETLINKVSQMVSLVIPLFIVSYKKAVDLSYAMEARGYVENKPRSSIYELKYGVSDYLSYTFMLLFFVFTIVSRFVL